MVALSSTSQTHYPELWSPKLAAFLLDQWTQVDKDIQNSPSNRASLVNEYHQRISERFCKNWEDNVTMKDGEDHPAVEDIAKTIVGFDGESDPILLSWEGIRPKVSEWKPCGEGLNEASSFLSST